MIIVPLARTTSRAKQSSTQRSSLFGRMNLSMTTVATVKLLVTKFVLLLAFKYSFSESPSFVGLDKRCARQNGTVCYHRAPEECMFSGPGLASQRRDSAINHEALIRVTILSNHADPLRPMRYLKLEWTQASRSLAGTIFVRVSPLVQGHVLHDQVICLSNLGTDETAKKDIAGPVLESNGPRHITLVLIGENATSSRVEIIMPNAYSEIMVAVPKYSIESFILQAVSITLQDETAYISLSPPSNKQTGPDHYVVYILTLVCYTYMEGRRYPHNENSSQLNILPSFLTSTKCSNSHEEIFLTYDASNSRPIMYKMTQPAYELVIDSKLMSVASDSETMGFRFRTPKFGYSALAYKKVLSATTVTSNSTGKTLVFSVKQINQDEQGNISDPQLAPVGKSSASSSEEIENETTDNSHIIWGSSTAIAGLLLVIVILFFIKRLRKKRSNNTVRHMPTAETYDVTETSKNKRKPHYIAIDKQPALSNSKKTKWCSDCCTKHVSEISSSDHVSDHLISTSQIVKEPLHQINSATNSHQPHGNSTCSDFNQESKQNDLIIELILNNLPESKNGIRDYKYKILLNGNVPTKQIDSETNSVHKSSGFSHKNGRNYFRSMWTSMLSLTEHNFQREDVEHRVNGFHVVAPELYDGHLEPLAMSLEWNTINRSYEDLIRNSRKMTTEDECVTICESTA